VEVMKEHDADVVIGSRFVGSGYRMGVMRKIGVALFSLVAKA
jgi:hypothetical protein